MKGQHNATGIRSRSFRAIEPLESRLLLAVIRYVDINSPGPTHDGTSWDSAYVDLQEALTAAAAGDEIHIADGTYKPTSDGDRSATFRLKNGVRVYGSYKGYNPIGGDPDLRNISLFPTYLSGDIGNPGDVSDNSYHVVTASGTDASAVLFYLIVTAGNADGAGEDAKGGGLYNDGGNPIISLVYFIDNRAGVHGGGVYNSNVASALFDECRFNSNQVTGYLWGGGGMFNTGSSPRLTTCYFTSNSAGALGGGMLNIASSNPQLSRCTFTSNSAPNGGGIYNTTSAPELDRCDFSANTGAAGAAMYNTEGSAPQLADCTFADHNTGGIDAGAVVSVSSAPSFIRCSFKNNRGYTNAGAIHNDRSPASISDCTFTDNHTRYAGGAITNYGAASVVSNCVFIGNTAELGAGAVYNNGGSPTVSGCTFASNSGFGGAILNVNNAAPSIRDCAFRNNTATGGTVGGALTFNGGVSGVFSTVARCTFTGNSAAAGGAIYVAAGLWVFQDCRFEANHASGSGATYGGGAAFTASSARFVNCAFVGNNSLAGNGGAILCASGASPRVVNCTLSGNSAGLSGGGVHAQGQLALFNSIVWGNQAPVGPQLRVIAALNASSSDVQGGLAGGTNIIDADPQFIRAPGAGPDSDWGSADDDFGDLRLRPTSPCVDAGHNNLVPAGVSTDLIGAPRFLDVPMGNIPEAIVDMGAYETWPGTFVDVNATGADDGTSWADAFNDLQDALATASLGQNIYVADGIYLPVSTSDRNATFQLKSGVSILGGYAGAEAADPDERDIALHPTVLSGEIGAAGAGDNSYHVISAAGVDATAVLDGITVTSGNANGTATNGYYGGGMLLDSARPTLRNCSFINNRASDGAAVYAMNGSSPTFTACTFTDNTAFSLGGAIGYRSGSSPSVVNSTFTNNYGYWGGAIGGWDATSTMLLLDSTFTGNTASEGGAVWGDGSSTRIIGCQFLRNIGIYRGGALYAGGSQGAPYVERSTFYANTSGSGGAIHMTVGGASTVLNSLFVGNTAQYGGALYIGADVRLINCTVAYNRATYSGHQLHLSGTASVSNSIVWTEKNLPGAAIGVAGAAPSVTYSAVSGGFSGTGNTSADPLFLRAASPGADSAWGTGDDDFGDLRPRLHVSSPVVDGGSNAALPINVTADYAGRPRMVDVPNKGSVSGPVVDMGAYEYVAPIAVTQGEFLYDAARPSLRFHFNGDLSGGSVNSSDLMLRNLTTNQTIPGSGTTSANYSVNGRSATWAIMINLPDGNYRATLGVNSVQDAANNPLPAEFGFDFFVLAGDANRDRKVDVADLGILASNWQKSPRVFSQADFNYDGTVNVGDLGILASNWQKSLEPPAESDAPLRFAAAALPAASSNRKTRTRLAETLLA